MGTPAIYHVDFWVAMNRIRGTIYTKDLLNRWYPLWDQVKRNKKTDYILR